MKDQSALSSCGATADACPAARRRSTRRAFLLGATANVAGLCATAAWAQTTSSDPRTSLSFEGLVEQARAAAGLPYSPPVVPAPDLIEDVDYSAHWQIRFREDAAFYPGDEDAPVQLFHPGRYFPEPVDVYVRSGTNAVAPVPFDKALFDMPDDSPAQLLPPGFGFAGFRVMRPGMEADWVSFLGASYFRTDGPDRQYGLSARGVAIDTGLARAEEFPRFSAFWLGPPETEDEALSVWAMLDGPSITGAYRFGLVRDSAGMDGHVTRVSARLFMRADVERLGVAPLTSMYWYSERDRVIGNDWRPEIHDSDGLALATGGGERLWRPLNNPDTLLTSSFLDENPQGFGLIQRDRTFANYQDDGVFYDKRPSAWVRPRGDWGRGAVQLVQIPTDDETFDNVVAYWVPERPARRGDAFSFDYDIQWRARDPATGDEARVVATRQGQGGTPGQTVPEGVGKMVVDFEGPALDGLDIDSGVEPVVEATNGRIMSSVGAYPVLGTNRWRLVFDFGQASAGPVSLRAYLRLGERALTETWLTDAWVDRRS